MMKMNEKIKNKINIGILAHVDAGKTTLSESILYHSGKISTLGRVDKKDAYLDNNELERLRGITIFSKQAVFSIKDLEVTLLDTPGHVDFSAEMERTLEVLDYAILVISGVDGVQGHTKTLWRLLEIYKIPTFIFVNKMDQEGSNQDRILKEIQNELDPGCIKFTRYLNEDFLEQLAMCNEDLMDIYLTTGKIPHEDIVKGIKEGNVLPTYFGSALKLEGIDELLNGIYRYVDIPIYSNKFGGKIFKITRDEEDNRLTHMKITGASLKIRDILTNGSWEEKVTQIRIYSGEQYEIVNEAKAGSICAVTGLTKSKSGTGIGIEKDLKSPILEPVLSYKLTLPDEYSQREFYPMLLKLEEEIPELHIIWNDKLEEIGVQVMGDVQIEVLQSIILERYNIQVGFDTGSVLYKETIINKVEGVGHFEPLRHYAEVHLILEPLICIEDDNSHNIVPDNMIFESNCSEDLLSRSWQNLVLTHLKEKEHIGVLTGSPITNMKITLVLGKAHNKHTEGGDFREATYRAVRQGLKEAKSIILEPYYEFRLELPEKMVGRAMVDVEQMNGQVIVENSDGEMAVLTGTAPVIRMRNYQKEVYAYTKGYGRLFLSIKGYGPCHNQDEVINDIGYDSERDVENPTGSVFCSQGAGFLVAWNEVKKYMHIESYLQETTKEASLKVQGGETSDISIDTEEIERIINRTFYANQGKKSDYKKTKSSREDYYKQRAYVPKQEIREEYLLIDGYNIIYAWEEFKNIIEDNMDGARMKFLDIISNYAAMIKPKVIVVFDAYRVERHKEDVIRFHNIDVIFTKQAQTADEYIERFSYENKEKYNTTVATSDGLEQIVIRGAGARVMSAGDLKAEIIRVNEEIKELIE